MQLGAFSISLNVADLDASRVFYEQVGFAVTGGSEDEGWLILRNGESTIGIFHGMFDHNILTFNPRIRGSNMSPEPDWDDVRDIQTRFLQAGLELEETVQTQTGAGYLTLRDPDGNQILIDQW